MYKCRYCCRRRRWQIITNATPIMGEFHSPRVPYAGWLSEPMVSHRYVDRNSRRWRGVAENKPEVHADVVAGVNSRLFRCGNGFSGTDQILISQLKSIFGITDQILLSDITDQILLGESIYRSPRLLSTHRKFRAIWLRPWPVIVR